MRSLQQLDLNLLKAFDALMDERNVSRAAERLHLSQPAVSGLLAKLRESFDDPLFIRGQRGIEPTNHAVALAEPVKQVLADIEALLQPKIFAPETAEMTVSVACTDYALSAVVRPFILALSELAPHIRVAAFAIDEARLPQQLAQRQIDFALVTPDYQATDTHALNLYHENYVCAVGSLHPLAKQRDISLQQFCETEQILVSLEGGNFSGVTDQALTQLGRQRKVTVSVQNFLIVPELIKQSKLLAVVPQRLVQGLPDIRTFTPPLEIQGFTKTLVWHARTHRDPAFVWLRGLMKKVCEGV